MTQTVSSSVSGPVLLAQFHENRVLTALLRGWKWAGGQLKAPRTDHSTMCLISLLYQKDVSPEKGLYSFTKRQKAC